MKKRKRSAPKRKRNALKYYPGYYKSRTEILGFTDSELYELLDALYGRDNLSDYPTHSELLQEALRQHQMDWLTPEGKQEKEYLQRYARAHSNRYLNPRIEGLEFETGLPVQFPAMHGKRKTPYLGSRYQQDIEPAGYYFIYDYGVLYGEEYEHFTADCRNPLVIPFNESDDTSYDEHSWKFVLASIYKKTGKQLSKALINQGFDSIITVGMDNAYLKECVGLLPHVWEDIKTNPPEDNIIPDGDGMWIID